jgi:2-dehydropantoate 2-reductase
VRVAVIGAGGLGSYVAAVLVRAGHEVTAVARGEHATAIERVGLHIESFDGDFTAHPSVVRSALDLDGADLALVAVKAYSLDEVAPQVAHLAGLGAVAVSLLNGVTACERLASRGVPPDRLVDGVAYMTAFRTAPGRILRKAAHQRLVVGSSTGAPHEASDRVRRSFAGTGVAVTVADDIHAELWRKMAVVCSLAVICSLTGEPMGSIRSHRLGSTLQRRAISEVIAVGRARGVALPPDTEARVGDILDAFPDDFHPSVIHDLKSGRRTEMEELGGVIAALATERGIEAPLHEAATCAVQLAERRR